MLIFGVEGCVLQQVLLHKLVKSFFKNLIVTLQVTIQSLLLEMEYDPAKMQIINPIIWVEFIFNSSRFNGYAGHLNSFGTTPRVGDAASCPNLSHFLKRCAEPPESKHDLGEKTRCSPAQVANHIKGMWEPYPQRGATTQSQSKTLRNVANASSVAKEID